MYFVESHVKERSSPARVTNLTGRMDTLNPGNLENNVPDNDGCNEVLIVRRSRAYE